MKTLISIAAILGMLAGPAGAEPVTYTLDAMHSMPSFSFMHLKLSQFRGRFDKISGTITLDVAAKSGSTDISIPIDSVSSGVPMLDNFLKGPRFFDTARFPVATFKSNSFKFEGDQLVSVLGELNLHGHTRPVVLAIGHFACLQHPLLKVAACGADATVTIRRSEFGLDAFMANDSDEVKLELAIEALKSP
jgi:polyisoprenoid-binding protein YceI